MAPPSLADLQTWLAGVITDPRGPKNIPLDRIEELVETPHFPVLERLSVYADAYFLRLLETLSENFPATRRALGDDGFRRAAAEYLLRNPSRSPSVENLGERFPEFFKDYPLSAGFPFLPDLAKLEWTVLVSLYTDRSPQLNPGDFGALTTADWERVRVGLDPTVQILKTDWAVEQLWRRKNAGNGKRAFALKAPAPRSLLVYRDDEWVQVIRINSAQTVALESFLKGMTLGETCAALEKMETNEIPLQAWFRIWIGQGIIKSLN